MAKTKRKPMDDSAFIDTWIGELSKLAQGGSAFSDMALVLVTSSLLDNSLMRLLDSHFVTLKCGRCDECKAGNRCNKNEEIFSQYRALDSFSKCSDVAFRMGLIPQGIRDNLSQVGTMRNRFAHHAGVIDFDDPEIADACDKLRHGLLPLSVRPDANPDFIVDDPKHGPCIDETRQSARRDRFQLVSVTMIAEMNLKVSSAKKPEAVEYKRHWD